MKFARLQKILEVPSADLTQTRRAKILNILLLGLTLLTIVIVVINFVGAETQTFNTQEVRLTTYVTAFFLGSSIFIYLTNKYWSSQLAAVLFLIVVTAGLFYGDAPYESIWGRNMIALVIPILMASLILDPRASFVMAGIISILSLITAFSLAYTPNAIGIVIYMAVALISWLTTRSLEQAVTELKATNVALDQRVEARTKELLHTNEQLQKEVLERVQAEEALEEERGMLAARVKQRTAEIQQANTQLQELLKVKDEFLAKMSHELRTPLSVILIRAEALQLEYFGALNEKQHENLAAIEENGQHLLKLINDILDVAKIQSGRVDLNYTTVDVAKLCRSMLTLVDPSAQSKQIQIEFCLDGTVQFIEADEKRLKQILINLLTNAIKFTHDQGRVGLDVQAKGDTIVFSVWDTGIGIAPDDINKLFEPFVQLDNSITRKYEGTGLGLTLVQQFTDMMKGTLSVETEPDKGSQFMVALPQTQPDSYHPVVDQAI